MVVIQQPAEPLAALDLARRFADLRAGLEDGVAERLMISFNMVMSEPLPDGVTTTDTYDSLNRLTKVVHENALSQVLAEYDYTLRTDGSRSKDVETELEAGGAYSTRTFDWVYDQLGRLTEEKLTSSLSSESYTDDYVYSLVGNRVELKATAANGTVTDTTSSYNARDQLLQENATVSGSTTTTNLQYDANGSLTSKITVGGVSYGYGYNLRNQLATATIDRTEQGHAVHITASYKYNDAGIRVENDETTTIDGGVPTTQTKLFLIDGNNPTGYAQVLEQLAAAAGQAVMSYIFGHQPIGQTDASGATKYILADGHDSTRLLVDAAANIAARFLYDAYGDLLGSAPGVLNLPATSILYTGQQFDPVLLQYYLRARYYDPATGEFASRDPFAGRITVPSSLHRYAYVGADPLNAYDPSGEFLLGLGFSLGSWALRGGLDAARMGTTLSVLYVTLGAGVGFGSYWAAGENPFVGAYNGGLIAASFRIAKTTGNWRGVGDVFLQASAKALARFMVEYGFGHVMQSTTGASDDEIAREAIFKGIDSFANGAWEAATDPFLPDALNDSADSWETAKVLIKVFDAGISTIIQNIYKDPPPATSEIVSDAITSASLAGAGALFKSLWKNNPQLPQSMSEMAKDEAFKYAAKFLFEFAVGFDVKGLAGLAEFFATK